MKTVKTILFAAALSVAVIGLSACGRSAGQRAASTANQNIDQMNSFATVLSQKGISIDTTGTPSQTEYAVPSKLSMNDLITARGLLEQYLACGQNALAISKRGDVHMAKGNEAVGVKLQNGITDATKWLAKVNKAIEQRH